MLEMESGSNDPISYMLTIVVLSLISNNGQQSIIQLLTNQILFGFLIGFSLALLAVLIMRHIRLEIDGLYPIFVTGIILLGYSMNEWLGGNGFLAVYIIGIVMGNIKYFIKRAWFISLMECLGLCKFFFIALLSVLVQGTMLPKVAKLLDVVEKDENVYKTFSDYQDETHTKLIECPIRKSNPWAGKSIM